MADEFTPEASVDFEALAAFAAAAVGENGDGPHFAPPPSPPRSDTPPVRPRPTARPDQSSLNLDPFQALEQLVRDQGLMYRELGDINSKLGMLQLQTILMFGGALLLAVVVYKLARSQQ